MRFRSLMSSVPPTRFEAAVLAWIANGASDAALREQLDRATVRQREHTGVGCYTTLEIATDVPASTADYARRGPLPGPWFESEAVPYGGSTLLWFENGFARCLEIAANGDVFPADQAELRDFTLRRG